MVPITKRMDLRDHYYTISLTRDDDPIFDVEFTTWLFSTYNICQSHTLEVTLTLQYAEKEITADIRSEAVHVVPGVYHVDETEDFAAAPEKFVIRERSTSKESEAGDSSPADNPLPPYESRSPANDTTNLRKDMKGKEISEKQ